MSSRPFSRKRVRIAVAIGVAFAVVGAGTAAAQAGGWLSAPSHDFGAVADSYSGHGTVTGNVLHNDHGATAVVRHTAPADGSVTVGADGSFTYTPKAGFTGTDTFTYTTTDAVELFKDTQANGAPLAPLAKVAGPNGTTTDISGEGYGSSLTPVPGRSGLFYGLTDRGPNADAPDGNKSEMLLDFTPQIGEFKLTGGKAELVGKVTLKGPKSLGGVPYSGRPPHDTSEVIDDVAATNADGTPTPVAKDPYGYDSEGLVALPDGTFWVSDEYGPYITHFDANGYELGRLTPYKDSPDNASHKILGHLPSELAYRAKNKGMEGLTVTPDGSTLVGVMQSALQQPDLGSTKAGNVAATRIVTVDLRTFRTRQYLYLLDDPNDTGDANSEITAVSDTKFLVDERDGNYEPFARKSLYEVDVNGATDVSGLTIGGKSPEAFVGKDGTNAALTALTGAGVNVAQKQPYLNVGTLVSQLDPSGAFFAHDKVEGVATADAGRTLYLSNDDDFGIDTIAVDPDGKWTVHQKVLPPTGRSDSGEILKVDTTKLPAVLKTVTVTIHVH
ncbi:esterase-like activity of phytase family protein [Actinacidiphila acidipaludis]|uniref:Esterase-like activity of phytase family protein n=1 Tax=Actinacidiphila acidipaludis TaxID=2873382 RepID=A0ABS7QK85_9ACTN|nr:esterase-like activity of phytase family protein [Streptomyces acidipaludis]MBY8882194.1 esterase-like activity of phytase family protein [Streptomyces acidipaludis]